MDRRAFRYDRRAVRCWSQKVRLAFDRSRPCALRQIEHAAPSVSASDMIAPPCSTAGRVQRSSRTTNSAVTFSGDDSRISMPNNLANGSGSITPLKIPTFPSHAPCLSRFTPVSCRSTTVSCRSTTVSRRATTVREWSLLIPAFPFFPKVALRVCPAHQPMNRSLIGPRFSQEGHTSTSHDDQEFVSRLDAESFACLSWNNDLVFPGNGRFRHTLHLVKK